MTACDRALQGAEGLVGQGQGHCVYCVRQVSQHMLVTGHDAAIATWDLRRPVLLKVLRKHLSER